MFYRIKKEIIDKNTTNDKKLVDTKENVQKNIVCKEAVINDK